MKPRLCCMPLLMGLLLFGAALAQAGGVVVVVGQEKDYYQACLESFRQTLEEPPASLILPENGDPEAALRIERELQARNPSVVATLGTRATRWAIERGGVGGSRTVCFAMVPSRASLGLDGDHAAIPARLTGVLLQIPLERQVDAIRKYLPEARRLGLSIATQTERRFRGSAICASPGGSDARVPG